MHEAGFASTSVRDIGSAVGMQSGSLYYYFREKEDILYEIQLMLNQRITPIPAKVEESGAGPLGKSDFSSRFIWLWSMRIWPSATWVIRNIGI